MVSRFRQVERLFPSVAQLSRSNSTTQQQRAATEQFQPQSCVDSNLQAVLCVHRPDDKVLMGSCKKQTISIMPMSRPDRSSAPVDMRAACAWVGVVCMRVYNLLSDLYHHRRDLYHLPSRT
jgi:hypothetical protein